MEFGLALFLPSAFTSSPIVPGAKTFHLVIEMGFDQSLGNLLSIQPCPESFR